MSISSRSAKKLLIVTFSRIKNGVVPNIWMGCLVPFRAGVAAVKVWGKGIRNKVWVNEFNLEPIQIGPLRDLSDKPIV